MVDDGAGDGGDDDDGQYVRTYVVVHGGNFNEITGPLTE